MAIPFGRVHQNAALGGGRSQPSVIDLLDPAGYAPLRICCMPAILLKNRYTNAYNYLQSAESIAYALLINWAAKLSLSQATWAHRAAL